MKPFQSILFASLLLASCSQESVLPGDVDSAVEILLNGGVSGVTSGGSTRAVVDNSYYTANDLPVSFARIDQAEDGSYPAYSTVTSPLSATRGKGADAKAIGFATSQFYLTRVNNNNTKLVGWYPQAAKGSTYSQGVVTFDISKGIVDVMLTQELAGNKTDKFGGSGKVFTFSHLLTQVTVKAFGDANAAAAWGQVTSVKVKGRPTSCTVTLPSTPAFTGSQDLLLKNPSGDADMGKISLAGTSSGSPATCGYAMFAPTTGATLTLEVATELGGARDITVTLPAGANPQKFTAGTAYTVTLEFKSTGITPSASISSWTSATTNPNVDL